jgi:hypothetical protein
MTDAALLPDMAKDARPPAEFPPVKPAWLRPVALCAILAAHIGLAALLIHTNIAEAPSLDSVNMDLVPEGDYIDQQEVAEAEATPPPMAAEEPDVALPPPAIMSPEAPVLPAKKDIVQEKTKKEERLEAAQDRERRQAQQARRAGAPGGHAQGSGHSQSVCLAQIAAGLRRHIPQGSFGDGSAHVTFNVHPGGGISIVSASGSGPRFVALARRIVASAHGPSMCGSAFLSQNFTFH